MEEKHKNRTRLLTYTCTRAYTHTHAHAHAQTRTCGHLHPRTRRHTHPTQWLDVNFRGLRPRSESDRSFLYHCAFLRHFETKRRNRVWGITVQLLWARNFEITQSRTAQWFDVNFRELRPRYESGRSFLGHCAFLRSFRTEPRNRV